MTAVSIELTERNRDEENGDATGSKDELDSKTRLGTNDNDMNDDDGDDSGEEDDGNEKISLLTIKGTHANLIRENIEKQRSLWQTVMFPLLLPLAMLLPAMAIGFFALTNKWANSGTAAVGSSGQYPKPYPYSHYQAANTSMRLHRPPLNTLVRLNVKTGNREISNKVSVDWLLDFAIIGFPKCGTSSLKAWLRRAPGIFMDDDEIYSMSNGNPGQLVQHFYKVYDGLKPGKVENGVAGTHIPLDQMKFGIKNPADIDSVLSLSEYRSYFPNTRFVVQLRHPVSVHATGGGGGGTICQRIRMGRTRQLKRDA